MKHTIIALSLLASFPAFAKDMSDTERHVNVTRDLPDGSSQYIGGCTLHQDYEGDKFTVVKELVPYFSPNYESSREQVIKKYLKKLEIELIEAAEARGDFSIEGVDDFTAEKITHKTVKGLDLYRLNVGVGGGNGMYLVFNRTVVNGKPTYEMLSYVFDYDVEFCDSVIWKK